MSLSKSVFAGTSFNSCHKSALHESPVFSEVALISVIQEKLLTTNKHIPSMMFNNISYHTSVITYIYNMLL